MGEGAQSWYVIRAPSRLHLLLDSRSSPAGQGVSPGIKRAKNSSQFLSGFKTFPLTLFFVCGNNYMVFHSLNRKEVTVSEENFSPVTCIIVGSCIYPYGGLQEGRGAKACTRSSGSGSRGSTGSTGSARSTGSAGSAGSAGSTGSTGSTSSSTGQIVIR